MANNGRAFHWAGQERATYAEGRSAVLHTSKYTFRCCRLRAAEIGREFSLHCR